VGATVALIDGGALLLDRVDRLFVGSFGLVDVVRRGRGRP
jgi:hypothetical protein